MIRMEIIIRTERRRIYNDDEKAAVVTGSFGVTVRKIARRFGIAGSLAYNCGPRIRRPQVWQIRCNSISCSAVPGLVTQTVRLEMSATVPQGTAPIAAERIKVGAEETVRPASRRTGRTKAIHHATSTLFVMWFRSANSHTGQQLSYITGRTDGSIRLRVRTPNTACNQRGVHRWKAAVVPVDDAAIFTR